MPPIIGLAFKWLVPWLISLLKSRTPTAVNKAIDAVWPIVEEMLADASEKGLGQLSVEFRAPYEKRMVLALFSLGLLG